MKEQIIFTPKNNYEDLKEYILKNSPKKNIFLVCGKSISKLKINEFFEKLEREYGFTISRFTDFTPNPKYESVVCGIKVLKSSGADMIIAVGGGSAMDVAKCIKLYSKTDENKLLFSQEIIKDDYAFIAMPTTAGTGSEATRYAVIYYEGNKQSVTDESFIPNAVVMDPSAILSLPLMQKKVTMLDALCHAVESFWSVNSTDKSYIYSEKAIRMIIDNSDAYLQNDEAACASMLEAAFIAGKAINITQTTAGHAMCYKLTGMYGIPHGQAAALCVSELWPYMLNNTDRCTDKRGKEYLNDVFIKISNAFGCDDTYEGAKKFKELLDSLELERPEIISEDDFEKLTTSVNTDRLKNNPVELDKDAINYIYHTIFTKQESC